MKRNHVSFYGRSRKGKVAWHRGLLDRAFKKCRDLEKVIRHPTPFKYHQSPAA